MNIKEFAVFERNVIYPYIMDILKMDKDIKCLTYRKSRIKDIFVNYERNRRYIRHYFMDLEYKPMDRHKIASVLMKSVLKSKVFRVNRLVENIPLELLMANEILAFYIAISVIESYRINKMVERVYGVDAKLDESELAEFETISSLCVPLLYHGIEINPSPDRNMKTYILNTCKALYYLKTPNDFDIFAYANILFLLEAYTDHKRKKEIEEFIESKKSL